MLLSVLAGAAPGFQSSPERDEPTMIPNIIVPPARRTMHHRFAQAVRLSQANVAVTIDDQVATTSMELVLSNPAGTPQQAELIVPVPDGVTIRGVQYDGTGPEPVAKILPRDEARGIYDAIVRKAMDPALVEFAGYNLIRTSAFPIPAGATQKLTVIFEQVLRADGDRIDYVLPRSESLGEGGVLWTVKVTVNCQGGIGTVYSPSHDLAIERPSGTRAVASSMGGKQLSAGAFRFSYMKLPEKSGMISASLIAYPDASIGDGTGGYFMLLATLPKPSSVDAAKARREVVLVLDRSGSMGGEKIEQARKAAIQVIDGLELGESFNIIDYSDSIASFSDKPVVKSAESADKARRYLQGIQHGGGTNIHDALIEGVRQPPTQGALPMILFLTDGLATVGERGEIAIRDAVKAANRSNRRIFSFGVGYDVNAPLLSTLSDSSRGATTMVLPGEDVEMKVSQVFARLSGPILMDPTLAALDASGSASTRAVREMLPSRLGDVFQNDQIIVLGQYTSDKPLRFRLSGHHFTRDVVYECSFPTTSASARNGFVPRIWATRKIAALTDELRQAAAGGQPSDDARNKELVEEIVLLSTRWGVMTEYTSFLATDESSRLAEFDLQSVIGGGGNVAATPAEAPPSPGASKSYKRAKEMLRDGGEERSGAAGVAQQENYALRQQAVNSASTLAYLGADMKETTVTGVQQVGDRVLFRRGGRWIDSILGGKEETEPEVTVEFGSDEYMSIVQRLCIEGRQGLLAMGGDVYMVFDGKRTLVKGPKEE